MIERDQPDCFPADIVVAVSSKQDGTMLDRTIDRHSPNVVENREKFCKAIGVNYEKLVYQVINYGEDEKYDTICDIDNIIDSTEVAADALYTDGCGKALFLPVADCVATVVYDRRRRALMLAHLGRHASVSRLMTKALQYMKNRGSDMADLIIWMSPSVKQKSYRMEYFSPSNDESWRGFCAKKDGYYLDIPGFNESLAVKSGVPAENIYISPINTADDKNYFSHSSGDISGRFAVIAMMK